MRALSIPLLIVSLLAALPDAVLAGRPSSRPTSRPARTRASGELDVDKGKPYTHDTSGFVFPTTVGAFRRVLVFRVDDVTNDLTVAYNDPDLKIVTAVSVYPADRAPLARHAAAIRQELLKQFPKAKVTADGEWILKQDGVEIATRKLSFDHVGPLNGKEQDLTTESFILARGAFFVKYHVIYPAGDAKAVRGRMDRFMETLKLPDEKRTKAS